MHWDEEFDIQGEKKYAPKQERKLSKTFNESEETSENNDDTLLPIRAKRTSVWNEEDTKSSKNKPGSNIIELERFQNDKKEDSEDDIPIIPDIDDLQDDPLNLPDVKKMISVDESTYKELDNQFDNFKSEQVSFGSLGDIDLSFLTSKLYPESEVQPCLEVWTLESLYNDLSKTSI